MAAGREANNTSP